MTDREKEDRPVIDEVRDFNRFLIELANLHLQYGELDEVDKKRLAGHKRRISPIEIMPPGSGMHPGYIEELVQFLKENCSEHDAEYRLDRLWNVLGAAFSIGRIDGNEPKDDEEMSDPAALVRQRKAFKDKVRIKSELDIIKNYFAEQRSTRVSGKSVKSLIAPLNALARKKGLRDFKPGRLRLRLKELAKLQH